MIDEFDQAQNGARGCSKCKKLRCSECMWKHIRQCTPTLYSGLRNQLNRGNISEDFTLPDRDG